MTGAGLHWLAENAHSSPDGFTFVRTGDPATVLAAFGAVPEDAVEPEDPDNETYVRLCPAGDWLLVAEQNIPSEGTRPEVLRRVSAGTEAVSVYNDIGKAQHQFGYAADGDVVTTLTMSVPWHWQGSEPDRFADLLTELADEPDDWAALLALVEGVFGVSVERPDLVTHQTDTRILPVLDDLLPRLPAGYRLSTGDPVVDLYVEHADPAALASVATIRSLRALAAAGLDPDGILGTAIRTGTPVSDDDPVGLELRRLSHAKTMAENYLSGVVHTRLSLSEDELRQRIQRGTVASAARMVLAGRYRRALIGEIATQRRVDVPGWRERVLADLAGVDVPEADLRAAEQQM